MCCREPLELSLWQLPFLTNRLSVLEVIAEMSTGIVVATGKTLNRFDRPVGASGVNVIVEIYVNGVKQLTKTVLTR